jgi:hypothetical protein
VRTLSVNSAVAGMMFSFSPPWKVPTVTTAGRRGSISRETMVWRRVMMCAPSTIGSVESCGWDP